MLVVSETTQEGRFDEWAIVELMGHRKLSGRVSEVEQFGTKMLRIDIPGDADDYATQLYGGGAIYCVTPTTEKTARAFAARFRPEPVTRWELPAPERDELDALELESVPQGKGL